MRRVFPEHGATERHEHFRATEDERKKKWDPLLEIIITVALGLAAIVAAGAAYLNEQQDHEATVEFNRALDGAIQASGSLELGSQSQVNDQTIFTQYLADKFTTESKASRVIMNKVMSPELAKEVKWWENAPHTGPTPFTPDNPHFAQGQVVAAQTNAQSYSEEAKAAADEGKALQTSADRYTLVEVILASALFLYGIAGVTKRFIIRLGTLGAGFGIFLIAVGLLIAEAT